MLRHALNTNEYKATARQISRSEKAVNDCFNDQNGKCAFSCKNAIKYCVVVSSPFTGEMKLLGICEKHFDSQIGEKSARSAYLGIL